MFRLTCSIFFLLFLLVGCQHVEKQADAPENTSETTVNPEEQFILDNFTKYEYQVPMRDGVKLYTAVYIPNDRSIDYPILLSRTPYSIRPYGTEKEDYKTRDMLWYKEMLLDGYIWVYQDSRGRYMSDGDYTNMRPYIPNKKDASEVDASSDAYDTVEWLINNVENNNGNVGVVGISYRGFFATAAAIDAHPAVKAVSPQAPMADIYFDDFHHNGTFFLNYATSYPVFGEHKEGPQKKSWWKQVTTKATDGYALYLKLKTFRNIGDSLSLTDNFFWQEMAEHPNYDEFWQSRNILPHLKGVKPAVMTVAGWYDAEDLYGSYNTYRAVEEQSPDAFNILISGPWVHGGWARTDGRDLGDIYFGEGISQFYRDSISKPFFDHFLKGKGPMNLPEAYCFETGTNQWRRFDDWPPKNAVSKTLYFGKWGKLSFDPFGKEETDYDEFVSDPENPVPYTADTVLDMPKSYMVEDQRFVFERPDVLSYQTKPLTEDVTLTGPMLARLIVSTSETDADWIVKLIDVHPKDDAGTPVSGPELMQGYQEMVRSEMFRGRYRNSFEHPEPFVPNEPTELNIQLQDVLHTFKKGHRIMVQVQSSMFPLIDMNPQKYVENIFEAEAADFVPATHRLHREKNRTSTIEVLVLEK